jgi:predicted DsbA family dithiol-disulfide isomerase
MSAVEPTTDPLTVDIWSDVVCPWCAIGKANLDVALGSFAGADQVEIRWHSFELDPDAPAAVAGDHAEQLAKKYGMPVDTARQRIDQVRATAAGVGLDMRFDRVRPGNTFAAHRVLHLAADRGVQTQVKERFFTGYFTEGAAIGLPEEVERLAVDAGLDADEVARVLDSDAYADEVRTDESDAQRLGATGVPFFVFDGRYAVGGAQPPEVMLQVLDRCWQERGPQVEVLAGGDADGAGICGPDGCEI